MKPRPDDETIMCDNSDRPKQTSSDFNADNIKRKSTDSDELKNEQKSNDDDLNDPLSEEEELEEVLEMSESEEDDPIGPEFADKINKEFIANAVERITKSRYIF